MDQATMQHLKSSAASLEIGRLTRDPLRVRASFALLSAIPADNEEDLVAILDNVKKALGVPLNALHTEVLDKLDDLLANLPEGATAELMAAAEKLGLKRQPRATPAYAGIETSLAMRKFQESRARERRAPLSPGELSSTIMLDARKPGCAHGFPRPGCTHPNGCFGDCQKHE